ncbi:uncharacterized protein DUF2484 [Yoonia maricola]|uniref:Uncharacterized protein DUF2484 n=1 Tax=Yoonia maricola TaxID=420999 RepID=A0A2M8WK73_9RHOB|nr:DUF2484 family protein [Yoonia maricola]PJI91332.1 uncharacterized protein DUF2484 [Yoonia maricola]
MGQWVADSFEGVIDPFILIGLWVVLAFVMAAFPSSDKHWRLAYVLIAVGVPLLIWITWRDGLLMGALALIVGGLVLRWPVYHLWQHVKRRFSGK